jgi:hypothetical protein
MAILRDEGPVPGHNAESMEPGVWFCIRALVVLLIVAGVVSIFVGWGIANQYKSLADGGWIGLAMGASSLVWFAAAGLVALMRRLVLLVQRIAQLNATRSSTIRPATSGPVTPKIVENSGP